MADTSVEQRRAERRNDKNFLDYEVISPQGEVVSRGLARTLNMSETGILLETSQPLAAGQTLRITLGLRDELVQITGRVAHSEENAARLYNSGVCLVAFLAEDQATYRHHLQELRQRFAE